MSHTLKALIAASLLLNLLLLGIVCGHAGRYFIESQVPHPPGLHDLTQSLPADKRKPFEEDIARFEQDNGELHEQLTDARKKTLTLLKAEPFNKEAYLTQVALVQQLRAQMTERKAALLAQIAQKCTPEERTEMAEMLRRAMHRE